MIDTHCHLDASPFDADRDQVLARAFEGGITGVVVPGVAPEQWEALLTWPSKDPRVQVALGIHPQALPELPEDRDEESLLHLDALLGRGIAIAVGECGLDGPSAAGAPLNRQLKVLKRHFALAEKHDLPVLVHCFRMQPALVELLKEVEPPSRGILLHSYSGGPDLAKFYAKKNCWFSFAGPVSYREARKPLDALRAIPLERLMAETDAPDQAPHPHRGQRSEPGYVALVISSMAAALGLPEEALRERTTENARAFFRCF